MLKSNHIYNLLIISDSTSEARDKFEGKTGREGRGLLVSMSE